MIKRNKTIATMMAVALFANSMPCVNAFAADTAAGDNASAVAVENDTEESITTGEKIDQTTTGAAVEVNDEVTDPSEFNFNKDTGKILYYKGDSDTVIIPEEIDGVKVTSIGDSSLLFQNVKKLVLPKTITSISDRTFFNKSSLETIVLPETLKSIGSDAFAGCTNLKNINIPESVTKIGAGAFTDCRSLESIELPGSLKKVENNMFFRCKSLNEVTFDSGISTIGDFIFSGCDNIKKLELPDSVTKINSGAFDKSGLEDIKIGRGIHELQDIFKAGDNIKKIELPETITYIIGLSVDETVKFTVDSLSTKRLLTNKGIKESQIEYTGDSSIDNADYCFDSETGTVLNYIGQDSKVMVPDKIKGKAVTEIGASAFSYSNASEITLPETVTRIGSIAFISASKLEKINIPDSVDEIEEDAFDNVNSNIKFYVSSESVKDLLISKGIKERQIVYQELEKVSDEKDFRFNESTGTITYYLGNSDTIVIPERINGVKVTGIGKYAFYFAKMKKIVIPKTITNIPKEAFAYNKSIETVVLPDTMKTIGESAFSNCINLKNINIPESVTEIGDLAFGYCNSLESAEIPGSVKNLGSHTFYQCKNLKDVTIDSGISKVSMCMFTHCKSLENLTLPDSIKEIKYAAFDDVNPDVKIHVTSDSVKKLLLRAGIKEGQID